LPTPLLAVVGLIEDASKAQTIHFKDEGDVILVIGETNGTELGGSEFMAQYASVEKGRLPALNYEREITTADFIRSCIDKKLLKSCHDLSAGGLAIALAESCFGPLTQIGASLEVESYEGRKDGLLFAETGARYLVSCAPGDEKKLRTKLAEVGLGVTASGKVGGDTIRVGEIAAVSLEKAFRAWRSGLEHLFIA
jgi:phosphoribosylformylglycinamidine synthase